MPIDISNAEQSTSIVILAFLASLLFVRRSQHDGALPVAVTQELKGLAMLAIVFAHISMLMTASNFLYPLTISAGVGVDLFLLMSGYGLTVGMMKKPMPALEFYQRRLIKVFIPFWLVIIGLFVADGVLLGIHYPATYILRSLLGLFPRASAFEDVNSPFWYISWMLMFYVLFPLLFMRQRVWLTALLLSVIANTLAVTDPFQLQVTWLHRLHTNAFSIGMLLAWAVASPAGQRLWSEKIQGFRNAGEGMARVAYPLLLLALTLAAGYMAYHYTNEDWPGLAQLLVSAGFDDGFFIGQATSLVTMLLLVVLFSLKKFEFRFLSLFGIYSYEVYLLHWPLMARYDVFYRNLPGLPWLAVILYLALFVGLGWVLQGITGRIGSWVDSKLGH